MGRLDGKVALVTGGTRGLGEAIARALASNGAQVVVTGRTESSGTRVADEIVASGGNASFARLELADEHSVIAAVDHTIETFGCINVLVNNAAPTDEISGVAAGELGAKVDDAVTEITTDAWRRITVPMLDGLMWSLKYAIPRMQEAGGGSIINISSTVSIRGTAGLDAYTAAKGAMNALTRSVAVTYAPSIRCNALIAGAFVTPGLAPLLAEPAFERALNETVLTSAIGRPEQLAMAAVFLASDESGYITGQLLPVDGGISVPTRVPKVEMAVET